jgi:hypothetical protein
MDFAANVNDNDKEPRFCLFPSVDGETDAPVPPSRTKAPFPTKTIMTKNPAIVRPMPDQPTGSETEQQHFDRILSRDQFKPLKAILNELRMDNSVMRGAIVTTNSYPNFLDKLGYRVVLVKQIHEQDCYSRLGPAGGIRAVLPHHDMATYSTLVTLVNFDSTVTTTPKSVDFFSDRLAEFKTQLMN